MQLPLWLEKQIHPDVFKVLEFSASKKETSNSPYTSAKRFAYRVKELQNIHLWYQEDRKHELGISIGQSDIPEIWFPAEINKLRKIVEIYTASELSSKSPLAGLGFLAKMKKAKPNSLTFKHKEVKCFHSFVGHGDWDQTMVELENSATLNRFLTASPICLATGHNTIDDSCSQWHFRYSESIYSIIRRKSTVNPTSLFFVNIEYLPIDPSLGIGAVKTNFPEIDLLQKLPDDAPSDILNTLSFAGYDVQIIEDLIIKSRAGDIWSLSVLSQMVLPPNFEDTFLEFASHENEEIRDYAAFEALSRNNKYILDIAKKHGISSKVKGYL